MQIQAQLFVVNAHNEPLNEVFIQLQEEHQVQFSFNDALLSDCKVTDSTAYNSVEEAVASLVTSCGLKMKYHDEVFVIYTDKKTSSLTYRFTGKVVDVEDGEPLPFTNVVMNDQRFITDVNGNFSYATQDSTAHLRMSYMGYIVLDTVITAGLNQDIYLTPASIHLQEVTIRAQQDSVLEVQEIEKTYIENRAGKIKLNHELASFLPGNNSNTIFNMLRLQPGILASGEQTNDYMIWGSYKGQTHIVYDGITMFNIGSFNDNVGAINPLMVKDIEVLKAGYNVHTGDRVGGVVNITGKSGDTEKLSGNIQLNQLIGSANVNIPIAKKQVLQAAMRYSYYDLFPGNLQKEPQERKFDSYETENAFRDFNIKFSGKGDNGDRYYVSMLSSSDEQVFEIDENNRKFHVSNTNSAERWQNGAAAFYGKRWKNIGVTNTTLAYSSLISTSHNDRSISEIKQPTKEFEFNAKNSISEASVKIDHHFPMIKKNQVNIGVGYIQNTSYLEIDVPDGKQKDYDETMLRWNAFVKDNISISKKLSIEPGLRVDVPLHLQKAYVQPRIKALYQIHPLWAVNAASGKYHQFIVENQIQTPSENNFYHWAIADDEYITVLESWHHVAGLSTNLSGYTIRLEGFYKLTDGLTRTRNNNENKRIALFHGDTRAYGMDVYIQKKIHKHNFWVSYTLSWTEERFDKSGIYHLAPNDQRHEIKGAALLNFHPIYFSMNYVFGSGFPEKDSDDVLATYNRMDVALMYKVKSKETNIETGISIINVLNHENLKFNEFRKNAQGQTFYSRAMPFTPSVFLNIGF